MNMVKHLKKILQVPEILSYLPDKKIFFLHAKNPCKEMYVEFQILDEFGADFSENEESYTQYMIQVDIFSLGDYLALEKAIKSQMKTYGFERTASEDLYEPETGLYHKAMRFSIILETEE